MIDASDQIFVLLKHWALGWPFWPDSLKPILSVLFSIVPIMLLFALLFGIVTVVERKAIGRIQNRYGPNRVGLPFTDVRLFGFGHFIADGIKALTKEDIVPRAADKWVHFIAPIALIVPVFLASSFWPYGWMLVP